MLILQGQAVADMNGFDLFSDHFLPDSGDGNLPSEVKQALIHGTRSLLRDESECWQRVYLPKFAAMAAQLRRDAARYEEDSRPRLQLALHFDELAREPSPEPARRYDDESY